MISNNKTIQIINVPLDLGASRRGTNGGPFALQIAGLQQKIKSIGCELAPEVNISVPSGAEKNNSNNKAKNGHFHSEILHVCKILAQSTMSALENNYLPLVLGGDHSIAMGSISAVSTFYRQRDQETGLIWFDAHGDMNTPGTSPSGNIHGMPLAHLLGDGDQEFIDIITPGSKIKPENVALIGIRDIDSKERATINASKINTFTMRDIDERGMAAVSREALEVVTNNTAGFHLSFDLDGCDPSVIPGTGTRVPGGVNLREAHLLLELCAESKKMLSMDVVELNPYLDAENISAEMAVDFVLSALGKNVL